MHLEGSCHCKAVTFTVQAAQPVPFCRCYCSICRKTAESAGYAINLGADFATLNVTGAENLRVYRTMMTDAAGVVTQSTGERNFCGLCGSPLWLYDATWPSQVHPQASAIDTPLPISPQHWHIMLASKPGWVPVELQGGDQQFQKYPDGSLADWHTQHGLTG